MSTRFYNFSHSACVIQHIASAVGTFGRVLECWDRQTREYVAIKVVRSIRKYRDAAMIEVDVLNHIAKNDKGNSWYMSSGLQLIELLVHHSDVI